MLIRKISNALLAGSVMVLIASFSPITYAHGEVEREANKALFVGLGLAPAKTLSAFHLALKQGDKKAARATLADDVLIFEGGVERSAEEYAKHHMMADMKYLAQMKSTQLEQQVYVVGELAYAVTRTQTQGIYNNKVLDYVGLETIVLKQIDNEWRIAHIHWSD